MKQFENESSPALLAQARKLVALLDALFLVNLSRKHLRDEVEDLPFRDLRALAVLGSKRCLAMSDFANTFGVPLSTATHIVERLVKKGFAVRKRSETDRRLVYVELSEEGRRRENIYLQNRLAMGKDMLASLSRGEREIFLEMLAKMVRSTTPSN
jgi:DNA-binding MarR family transcriptional regulator